jgi:hypothetical protein
VLALVLMGALAPAARSAPMLPLGHSGRWITDSAGRVVIVHGTNMVYKLPPYYPGSKTFRLSFTTARVSGAGRFPAWSVTEVAAPALVYGGHYAVNVTGGAVLSGPGAGVVQIAACPGAGSISVTLAPGAGSHGSCRPPKPASHRRKRRRRARPGRRRARAAGRS